MSGYDRVIHAIEREGLDWNEIDRVLLSQESYDEFRERASFNPGDYATTDKPAVRPTNGEEKLVYVDEHGYLVEIEL